MSIFYGNVHRNLSNRLIAILQVSVYITVIVIVIKTIAALTLLSRSSRRFLLYNYILCLLRTVMFNNITVWTVVQTVLTANFNSYGDRQISTPTQSISLNRSTKKIGTIDYIHEGTSNTKFGRNLFTRGFLANWWNIKKNYFYLFIPFFFDQPTGQTRWWIFEQLYSPDIW